MSLQDVFSRITLFGFNDVERQIIAQSIANTYNRSPAAQTLYDDACRDPYFVIQVFKTNGASEGKKGLLRLNMSQFDNAIYIGNDGTAYQSNFDRGLTHEMIHVLTGLTDNTTDIDYQGDVVRKQNHIFRDLGWAERNSYFGVDLSGTILTVGTNYTDNTVIGRSYVADLRSGLPTNKSSIIGDFKDLMIGDARENHFEAGFANDFLWGFGGNDTLDGGDGADKMYGGKDDDTYFVDDARDVVSENPNEGTDIVITRVDYTLSDNVENLTLSDAGIGVDGGKGDNPVINGTGNGLDNIITGNDASNRLEGGGGKDRLIGKGGDDVLDGGSEADVMDGGADNDTYYVDTAGDTVTDSSGASDTVNSSINYTLGAGLENLILLEPPPPPAPRGGQQQSIGAQAAAGGGAVMGTGNDLDNIITGNSLDNRLKGLGGNDRINGGAGDDTAVYRGKESEYDVKYLDNIILVRDSNGSQGGRDGFDVLIGVEHLEFAPDDDEPEKTPPQPFRGLAPFRIDPLVLDLDGDGVQLISLAWSQTNFDFDGNNFRERAGWISPQDGFLARDINGNGRIDNGSELFGNATQDAFTMLRGFDGNGDGKIASADAVWASLRVWQDANSNGLTDAGELKTLAERGIASFSLGNTAIGAWQGGNYIDSRASFVMNHARLREAA